VHALRRQAEVPHDRHSRLGDRPHLRHDPLATLQLDGIHARLLQVAAGVADRFGHVRLVAHEGKVADQQGARRAAFHRAGMVQHLFHGDG